MPSGKKVNVLIMQQGVFFMLYCQKFDTFIRFYDGVGYILNYFYQSPAGFPELSAQKS
jgi:hypothetical protein